MAVGGQPQGSSLASCTHAAAEAWAGAGVRSRLQHGEESSEREGTQVAGVCKCECHRVNVNVVATSAGILCRAGRWESWLFLLQASYWWPCSSSLILDVSVPLGFAGRWVG